MQFDYVVEFRGAAGDQAALTQALKDLFRAQDISITTKEVADEHLSDKARLIKPTSPRVKAILEVFADGKVHASREVVERTGAYASQLLKPMAEAGYLHRVRQGVYCLPGARYDDQEVAEVRDLSKSLRKFYNLFDVPRTSIELRDLLGVTRQRVEQRLKRMIELGYVKRIEVDGIDGRHLYYRDTMSEQEVIHHVARLVGRHKREFLNIIPVLGAVKVSDLAEEFDTTTVVVRRHLDLLVEAGLVSVFDGLMQSIVTLTAAGRAHPDFDMNATRLAPLAPSDIVNPVSAGILTLLMALGEARSVEMTMLMEDLWGLRDKLGNGRVLRQLKLQGLVERLGPDGDFSHYPWRLSAIGYNFLLTLGPEVEALDKDDLDQRLKDLDGQRREKASARARKRFANTGRLPDLLEAIPVDGTITSAQALAAMSRPYPNANSIHLALKSLEERGLIKRVGRNETRSTLWRRCSNETQQSA